MKSYYDEDFGSIVCTESNVEDCLNSIRYIGFDYDGMDGSIEGLKSVIDCLVSLANNALDFLYDKKIFKEDTIEDDENSYIEAYNKRRDKT